jgi:hypothetical protein
VKVFGAVEIYRAEFLYRQDKAFNAQTYLAFLQGTEAQLRFPSHVPDLKAACFDKSCVQTVKKSCA